MGSHNSNCKVLRNRFRCSICPKGYMMEWAKKNHEKLCLERDKAIENNLSSYSGV
ncbi:hypothetical protein LCGC14_2491090 [marine sediment metagenome]|uniref:Uncharacterized protein n=1 Tax=marine sediment metagenome TaxID=412755 RepID=A0A0F9DGJ7_9ZZZZ